MNDLNVCRMYLFLSRIVTPFMLDVEKVVFIFEQRNPECLEIKSNHVKVLTCKIAQYSPRIHCHQQAVF